ncbi:type II toxin-antitoxin system death-on-curing family toxin [Cognatishimia sp. MH4019]|uniref:type II toxin-antitoxin system death-on-curing family toxin n=1 Tax=Cognatishimia sp. MH4019 TaxID=2854030 RepID=UPI001CD1F3BE|nr:Fic family protein [Cognatishimia sp. MH4019]
MPIVNEHYQITLNDALNAHEEALRYGGRSGVSNLGMVESAIGRPYSGYHETLAQKASALLHSMIGNHGFVDGNKRTSWILTMVLIDNSGAELVLKEDDLIDDLVVDVARGALGFDDLVPWFEARLVSTDA